MRSAPATRLDSDELGFVPLWRERTFLPTLLLFGGAAALPLALTPARAAWPAALALLGVLAAVDLGALAPPDGALEAARRGLRFAAVAAVAPLFVGLAAAAVGIVPGRALALLLLGVGALLALAAIAPLELAAQDGETPRGGRVLAASGAALSLATASLWQATVQSAELRLAVGLPLPSLAAALLVAVAAGIAVAAAGLLGGAALRRLRYRSFHAPRAAAAALLLTASGGIAAAGLAWF